MTEQQITDRIESLLQKDISSSEVDATEIVTATLSLLIFLYGNSSIQAKSFVSQIENTVRATTKCELSKGTLQSIKGEIDTGLIGSLQKTVTGEVLTDFLKLARAALEEKGDEAKNVAAVLSAALFEDTIRRLATNSGIPHIEKLAEVLTELKNKGVLDGTQIGVAQSYLTFRNKSLHAEWDKVGRETVASVLAFTEQLLLKHFS